MLVSVYGYAWPYMAVVVLRCMLAGLHASYMNKAKPATVHVQSKENCAPFRDLRQALRPECPLCVDVQSLALSTTHVNW